jgi:hypothetical protein
MLYTLRNGYFAAAPYFLKAAFRAHGKRFFVSLAFVFQARILLAKGYIFIVSIEKDVPNACKAAIHKRIVAASAVHDVDKPIPFGKGRGKIFNPPVIFQRNFFNSHNSSLAISL